MDGSDFPYDISLCLAVCDSGKCRLPPAIILLEMSDFDGTPFCDLGLGANPGSIYCITRPLLFIICERSKRGWVAATY